MQLQALTSKKKTQVQIKSKKQPNEISSHPEQNNNKQLMSVQSNHINLKKMNPKQYSQAKNVNQG